MLNLEEDSLSVNQVKGLLQMNCKYELCCDTYVHYVISHQYMLLNIMYFMALIVWQNILSNMSYNFWNHRSKESTCSFNTIWY